MREHMGLYRGKRVDNGKWVEGYLYEHEPPLQGVVPKGYTPPPSRWFIVKTAFADWNMPRQVEFIEVDPDTVGECSGLQANGKLIFEGDILHVVSECCDYDYKTDVGRKYGYISGLYVDGDFNGGDFTEIGFAVDYWSEDDADVEIIGNIHDNTERLGSER